MRAKISITPTSAITSPSTTVLPRNFELRTYPNFVEGCISDRALAFSLCVVHS